MDVGLHCESPFCLSLTGTKIPLSLSRRTQENERGYTMMRILEEKRRKSLLRAKRRIKSHSNLRDETRVDVDTAVAMKQYTSSLDTLCERETQPSLAISSLTDIASYSSHHRMDQTRRHTLYSRSVEDLKDSYQRVYTNNSTAPSVGQKRKKSRRKTSAKDLLTSNSLVLPVNRERKPRLPIDMLILKQCPVNRNPNHLPLISSHGLIVQSVVPLLSIKEERSPEQNCKLRGKAKVFLSERQSQMLKYEGIPAAPPCTPTREHLERHDYIASMSDVRSQRLVKTRLAAFGEKLEQQKTKADEEARILAKKIHLQSIAALKSQQRAEIYALNKLMTDLEHENFLRFCQEKRDDSVNK